MCTVQNCILIGGWWRTIGPNSGRGILLVEIKDFTLALKNSYQKIGMHMHQPSAKP